jgi:hypothetical protein
MPEESPWTSRQTPGGIGLEPSDYSEPRRDHPFAGMERGVTRSNVKGGRMNLRLQNQLNMVGACVNVAESSEYKPVWSGSPPADVGADIAQLATDYDAITAKAALADRATGGASDAKSAAEAALEDAAFIFARALAVHFKKSGDLDRRGKVNVTKSEIARLRTQELVNRATAIRDLGAAAVNEPGAEGRGITGDRVAELTAAIDAFSSVMSAPRGQIVNRSTLLRELETEVAALLEKASDIDDLVLQFDRNALGRRFIEAWRRARFIVDTGGAQTHLRQLRAFFGSLVFVNR